MQRVLRQSLRYILAIAAVGVAYLLTEVIWQHSQQTLSILFIVAVMLSAGYGGLGPGLLAGALSAVASHTVAEDMDNSVRVVVFCLAAMFVSWLGASRRQSEEALREAHAELEMRVRDRTADLSKAVAELRDEITQRKLAQEQITAYQGRLRKLAAEMSRTEERERRRIAVALHDAVGHALAVAVIKLRSLLEAGAADGAARDLEDVCKLIEESIRHARSLTLDLSPPILYELGLGPAVEWLAERLESRHALGIEVADDGGLGSMQPEVRAVLFRAIGELLINVVKHAGAKRARVELRRDGEMARVAVEDDGAGFDSAGMPAQTSGFGVFSIREQVAHLGGEFELDSQPGCGCRVRLAVPLGQGEMEA